MSQQSRRRSRIVRRKKSTRKRTNRVSRTTKSNRRTGKRAVARKTRTRRRARTRVRRGRGPACSRPRVDSDVASETAEAEPMPENLPLPSGATRVAAMSQYADLPQAVTESASPKTEIVGEEAAAAETDMLPIATSLPRKPTPKLVRHPKPDMVETIMNFPDYRILRESPKREEIKDAMLNYVYHPNYFDPFEVHPRNVNDQLW